MGSACSSGNSEVDIPKEILKKTEEAISDVVTNVNNTVHAVVDIGGHDIGKKDIGENDLGENYIGENDIGEEDGHPHQIPDMENDADDEGSEPKQNGKLQEAQVHTIEHIEYPTERYKLVVLAGQRLWAEPARLIMHYADVSYDEYEINDDQWGDMKHEGKIPSKDAELPLLYVDGVYKENSMAASRYLARELELSSEDEEETAKMDLLMSGWAEVASDVAPPILDPGEEDKIAIWNQLKKEKIIPFLDRYTQFLEQNQGAWFVGNQVSWVDLTIADFLGTLCSQHDSGLLINHPQLQRHMEGIQAIPNINHYYTTRPACLI